MKVLSLNYKGLISPSKKLVLKGHYEHFTPNVISLQETMADGDKATTFMHLILLDWDFLAINSMGDQET